MIKLVLATKVYEVDKGPSVRALDEVTLTFGEKGLVFILGKSGSGKSTLLNVIGGLDRLDAGDIVIKGKSTKDFTQAEFDSYRNTYVGFIFQEYNLLPDLTVGDNIALAMRLQGLSENRDKVEKVLEELDLKGLYERKPNELSGGQKQRVAMARALVKDPQIIMADEPTGALDSKTGTDIFETLKKLSKERLVICVSHDREFAEEYGDRIIELKDGRVISDVTKSDKVSEKPAEPTYFSFPKGHVLASEDIAKINETLKNAEGETIVSSSPEALKSIEGASIKKTNSSFTATTPELVNAANYGYDSFKTKKSHLPFKTSLRMAMESLRSKPVRLAVTFLLIFASLTLFGVAGTLATYSTKTNFVSSYEYFAPTSVSISKVTYERFGQTVSMSSGTGFSKADVDGIATDSNLPFNAYVDDQALLGHSSNSVYVNSSIEAFKFNSNVDYGAYYYNQAYKNFVYCAGTASSIEKETGATILAGVYPAAADEIGITDYFFSAIQNEGLLVDLDATNHAKIVADTNMTPGSFLAQNPRLSYKTTSNSGDSYHTFKIVAVLDSHIDLSDLKTWLHKDEETGYYDYASMHKELFSNYLYRSYANAIYGNADFYKTFGSFVGYTPSDTDKLFTYLSSNFTPTKENINLYYNFLDRNKAFTPYKDIAKKLDTYSCTDIPNFGKLAEYDNHFGASSAYSAFVSTDQTINYAKKPFFYAGLGTAAFAILLLATFIASSITYQKRKIGILRAIGARGRDIYGIFYLESLVITLISAIAGVIATGVIDWALTNSLSKTVGFHVSAIQFGPLTIAMILALALVTATIASFTPCYLISSKRPIDSINDK